LTAEKTLIGPGERSFVDVINASLSPETRLRMFWPSTNSWEPSIQKKVTKALSPVLCFNAAQSNEDVTWWRRVAEYDIKSALHHMPQEVQTWIPATMDAFFDEQRGCYQVRSSGNEKTPAEDVIRYELSTVVYQILDEFAENDEHFVALIKVAPQRWILFNDFTVIEVNDVEARQCMPWKIPAIIMYSNPNHRAFTAPLSVLPASVSSLYQLAVSNPEGPSSLWTENSVIIKDNVFYDDTNMALRASTLPASFVPLAPPEMPRRGDVVALDAEFVALRIEEAEVMSDGRRKVTRPSLLYLARVSVLRGDNAVPFVDDYIHTPEPVADYLTRFSGLHPGDLDPSQSKHHLTSLKNAYRKLRYLVDRGVMFVGHSLKQDFRIINIFVPPEQIIDTSELFRFEGQRKISLRFLARHVLQQDIQEDTHDSIEDARTALLLYKKYVKLREAGKVEDALQDIYAAGRAKNWQV
jgi:PAB-dependent poly(A)-specific ribonuclease subunit 2